MDNRDVAIINYLAAQRRAIGARVDYKLAEERLRNHFEDLDLSEPEDQYQFIWSYPEEAPDKPDSGGWYLITVWIDEVHKPQLTVERIPVIGGADDQ